jgi:hypothetical protein
VPRARGKSYVWNIVPGSDRELRMGVEILPQYSWHLNRHVEHGGRRCALR